MRNLYSIIQDFLHTNFLIMSNYVIVYCKTSKKNTASKLILLNVCVKPRFLGVQNCPPKKNYEKKLLRYWGYWRTWPPILLVCLQIWSYLYPFHISFIYLYPCKFFNFKEVDLYIFAYRIGLSLHKILAPLSFLWWSSKTLIFSNTQKFCYILNGSYNAVHAHGIYQWSWKGSQKKFKFKLTTLE